MSAPIKTVDIPLVVFSEKSEEVFKSDDSDNLFQNTIRQSNAPMTRSEVCVKYSLDVREINEKTEIEKVRLSLDKWWEKAKCLSETYIDSHLFYITSSNIANYFRLKLGEEFLDKNKTLFGSYDNRGHLRSVALIQNSNLYSGYVEISVLLAKPKSPQKRIHGAGAVLIDRIERECVFRKKTGIVLVSSTIAESFYNRMGFVHRDSCSYAWFFKDVNSKI